MKQKLFAMLAAAVNALLKVIQDKGVELKEPN